MTRFDPCEKLKRVAGALNKTLFHQKFHEWNIFPGKKFWKKLKFLTGDVPFWPHLTFRFELKCQACKMKPIGKATFFVSSSFRPVFKFLIGQYSRPIRLNYLKTFFKKNLLDGNLFPFVWWCCVNSFLVSKFETYASPTYAERDSDWSNYEQRGLNCIIKVSMQFSFIQMQFLKQLVSI